MSKPGEQPERDAFAAVKAAALFPRRESLSVHEISRALPATAEHVAGLLASGELKGVDSSHGRPGSRSRKGRLKLRYWRVPVAAYDDFIEQRRERPAPQRR